MTQDASLPVNLSVHEVKAMLEANHQDLVLLDCREVVEYETARIEGAILVPLSQIQQHHETLRETQDKHVVVYCHHGGRSLQLTQWLRKQGFPRVQNMAGGIDAWAIQIDPETPRY